MHRSYNGNVYTLCVCFILEVYLGPTLYTELIVALLAFQSVFLHLHVLVHLVVRKGSGQGVS